MTIVDIDLAPVRLCCGRRHYGAQCPDGKVMCCICFSRFTVSELNITEDGTPEDVCLQCAAHERAEIARRLNTPEPS